MELLKVEAISVAFGGVQALTDVSFALRTGQVVGLIGPNGAGKTTLLNCITRFTDPAQGRLRIGDRDLLRCHRDELARFGVARTFQHLELFQFMTVRDNVLIALDRLLTRPTLRRVAAADGASELSRGERGARVQETLAHLRLTEYADWPVSICPLDVRKRVDLARALVRNPRLLLVDEPVGGLSPARHPEMAELLRDVAAKSAAAVLIVEHHMPFVMAVCDRVLVLDFGRLIADGPPAAIRRDPRVLEAYLGRRGADKGAVPPAAGHA